MRFFWRSSAAELVGHSAWVNHLEGKNRRQGTSAPTLAASWSGPLDLLGALATEEKLRGIQLEHATVEEKAIFDTHGGNARNHDLVLRGTTAGGDSVVICVEAKAGEPLGATVSEQVLLAAKAKVKNPSSKASARVVDLVDRLCRYPIADPRVGKLR
jgi:hypothetical protein